MTVTTRVLLDLVAAEVGHPVGVRSLPKLAVRALGLVNPMLRELAEMSYEFDEPFVLDTSKYQAAFGTAGTPLAAALAVTVAWYLGPGQHVMTANPEPVNARTTPLVTVTPEPAKAVAAGFHDLAGLRRMLPPLWALARAFGVRPYHDRWHTRI